MGTNARQVLVAVSSIIATAYIAFNAGFTASRDHQSRDYYGGFLVMAGFICLFAGLAFMIRMGEKITAKEKGAKATKYVLAAVVVLGAGVGAFGFLLQRASTYNSINLGMTMTITLVVCVAVLAPFIVRIKRPSARIRRGKTKSKPEDVGTKVFSPSEP